MKLGVNSYITEPIFYLKPEVTIGNYSSIGPYCSFFGECEHPSVIDKNVVSSYPFARLNWNSELGSKSRGPIVIGNDVWVGQDCVFLDGVKVGNGAIIGAFTVVSKDIPDYAVAVGNPVILKRMRFSKEIIDALNKIAWWNWPEDKIREALPDMFDVNKFVLKY